ncbi:hypothetical protein [Nitrosomonas communis]|nr:hypothetical protein [Nitrosomonas communis]
MPTTQSNTIREATIQQTTTRRSKCHPIKLLIEDHAGVEDV